MTNVESVMLYILIRVLALCFSEACVYVLTRLER